MGLLRWTGILAIALSATLAAQNQEQKKAEAQNQQLYTLSVRTNLVLVPVVVTDKAGNHITGLKQQDFEVRENGKRQQLVSAEELSADTAKVQSVSTNPNMFSNQLATEHPKKLEIIAIDQINTPFSTREDARRGLLTFLAKSVDANTLLALVAFRTDGVHVIHNFTADPAVLVAAVNKVQPVLNRQDRRTQNISGDLTEADVEAAQIEALFANADVGGAISTAQALAAARASIAQGTAKVDASMQSQDALITLECLQQVAQYFRGVPGRKSLIWASSAFPFALGAEASALTRGTTYDDWQQTFHLLQDANVSVYPVDVSGLVPAGTANNLQSLGTGMMRNSTAEGGVAARTGALGGLESGRFMDPIEARHETMRQLADITGGQAFYNSNNGAELFRRAAEDSGQYYQLAYYAQETGKPGWRKLSVKVDKSGVKVRSRDGYFFHNPENDSESMRSAEEIIALDSDFAFRGLPITGVWQQVEKLGNQRKVHFQLSIPAGVPLIETDKENHISFDFRVSANAPNGKQAAILGQRLDSHLKKDAVDEIQSRGLGYANTLTLDPGRYMVHFVVRDNLRGALGSVVVPLTVE